MCYMFLRNKGHLDHHWTIPKVQHQNGQGGVKVQCPCLGRVEVFFCSWIIQIIQIDLHLDMYLKCLNIEIQCFLTQLAIQLAFWSETVGDSTSLGQRNGNTCVGQELWTHQEIPTSYSKIQTTHQRRQRLSGMGHLQDSQQPELCARRLGSVHSKAVAIVSW